MGTITWLSYFTIKRGLKSLYSPAEHINITTSAASCGAALDPKCYQPSTLNSPVTFASLVECHDLQDIEKRPFRIASFAKMTRFYWNSAGLRRFLLLNNQVGGSAPPPVHLFRLKDIFAGNSSGIVSPIALWLYCATLRTEILDCSNAFSLKWMLHEPLRYVRRNKR